jgi:hypothetical protein
MALFPPVSRTGPLIALAARHKLPVVYVERRFAAAAGLVSYGPEFTDQYGRAKGFIDRILKGEKPRPDSSRSDRYSCNR